jgi:Amt family ammonium transporter
VGGTLGAILTGVFATRDVCDPALSGGSKLGVLENGQILVPQIMAVVVTWVLAGAVTFILLKILDATMGLRVTQQAEIQGLDLSQHGEEGYIFI